MRAACPRAGSVSVDFHSLKYMLNYGDSFKERSDYLKKDAHSKKYRHLMDWESFYSESRSVDFSI